MSSDSSSFSLPAFDALLLVSFGGPEGPDDVGPFLEKVAQGRPIPAKRLAEVAKHYSLFGGISPLNAQIRSLLAAIEAEFATHGPEWPVYWGNRNWRPFLADTLQQMAENGVRRALALVTSAFGAYSGCRQYLEDIENARRLVGTQAPLVEKLRLFYNHPGFIEPMVQRAAEALASVPDEQRQRSRLIFTAHSIPLAMAGCRDYQKQLTEACRLIADRLGRADWDLVYQSRSGPPQVPWLEPDIADHIRRLRATGDISDVIVVPVGFLCENMEVVYDLDVEAARVCKELGIRMVRAAPVGVHPRFVTMIRELIHERIDDEPKRLFLGSLGPSPDRCPDDCCQ